MCTAGGGDVHSRGWRCQQPRNDGTVDERRRGGVRGGRRGAVLTLRHMPTTLAVRCALPRVLYRSPGTRVRHSVALRRARQTP